MAFFQAKTGGERMRNREKKNYRSDQFLPDQEQKIKKNSKKIQKIKKYHYGFLSSQTDQEKKSKKKKAKKFKNIVMASFQAKTGWERPSQREKRNYRSDKFLPDLEQKIKKKQQKNSKN